MFAPGKKKTTILLIGALIFSLAFGLLCCVYLVLPIIVESRVASLLSAMQGLDNLSVGFRKISVAGADIGPIRLGRENPPAVLVDSVRLSYTPKSLFKGRIDTLQINGVTINCQLQEGKLRLPGVEWEHLLNNRTAAPTTSTAPGNTIPDLPFKRAEVRNATILLDWDEKPYRLPFEADIALDPSRKGHSQSLIRIYPRSQKISATLVADRNESELRLGLKSDDLELDRFQDLIRLLPDTVLGGSVVAMANATLGLEPFAIKSMDVQADWKHPLISTKSLGRIVGAGPETPLSALRLNAHSGDGTTWEMDASPLYVNTPPVQTELAGLRIDIRKTGSAWSALGRLHVNVRSHPDDTPASGLSLASFSLPVEISGDLGDSGNWKALISNGPVPGEPAEDSPDRSWKARIYDAGAALNPPVIVLTASGSPGQGTLDGKITIPGITVDKQPATIRIAELALTATADWALESGRWRADLAATAVNTTLRSGATVVTAPATSVSGRLETTGADTLPMLTGHFKTETISLKQTDPPLLVTGGSLDLPFVWPAGEQPAQAGSFRIQSIHFDKTALGSVSGTIRQRDTGIVFSGSYDSSFVKGLSAVFEGHLDHFPETGPDANISLKVPSFQPAAPMQLKDYIGGKSDITVSGRIEAAADLFYGSSGISGTAMANLSDGDIQMKKSKISMTGIATTIYCDDLPQVRSRPGQVIRFEKALAGGITIEGGSVDYQIESPRSLLIEKSSLSWCNGIIDTQSLRIVPDTDDYRLTLYCDRLNLAMLLEQLAGVRAEGKGAVNGKIPIEIINKEIKFINGFLYSTPGDGGKIRLMATDILTAGLPVNTPQFAQLELAREALKDYDYQWAKLGLATEGEDLLLQLQFDGKPSKPLPFVYKAEIGGFVKVDADSPGSDFQGISLDINMRLPLNKMLQYKDITNMIQ